MKRILAVLCLMGAAAARSEQAEADKCVASLTPPARLIYDTALAQPMEGATLHDLLTARVRTLILTGQVGLFQARPAAEAASDCLRLARSWPQADRSPR